MGLNSVVQNRSTEQKNEGFQNMCVPLPCVERLINSGFIAEYKPIYRYVGTFLFGMGTTLLNSRSSTQNCY